MHKNTSDFIQDKFKTLEINISFRNAIEKARNKIGIQIGNAERSSTPIRLSPKQKLIAIDEIDKILEEFNLPIYFRDFLQSYLETGDFEFGEQRNIKISSRKGRGRQGEITLTFFADTTLKDIQDIWHAIEAEQKKFVGYSQKRKTNKKFDRDKRIYELSIEGLSYAEIAKKINSEFEGQNLIYYDIGGILSKFKKNIIGSSPQMNVLLKDIKATDDESQILNKILKVKKSLSKAKKNKIS